MMQQLAKLTRYSVPHVMTHRIRKIVRQHIDQTLPHTNAHQSKILQLLNIIICVICFTSCAYHIAERVMYYLQFPIGVSVYIREQRVGDFPAVFLGAFTSPEFQNYVVNMSKINKNIDYKKCGVVMQKYIRRNGSDVNKLWQLLNSPSVISKAFIKNLDRPQKNASNNSLRVKPIDFRYGTGALSYTDEKLSYGDGSVRFTLEFFNHPDVTAYCSVTFVMLSFLLKELEKLNVPSIWPVDATLTTEVIITIQEYVVLNTKKDPCVSLKILNDCEQNCFVKNFPKSNCRFPFDPRNLPYCKTSEETAVYHEKILSLYANIIPSRKCRCSRACNNFVLTPHVNINIEKSHSLEMFVGSRFIRTMIETYIYDLVSLFCDIGGVLGLYLGLSLLAIVDVANTSFIKIFKRRKSPTAIHQSLNERILTVLTSETNIPKYLIQSKIKKKGFLWFVTLLVVAILWLYQTYSRINHYFSYPIMVTIELADDFKIQLPSIVVCSESRKLIFEKRKIGSNKNDECRHEKVSLLDMLDSPSKFANDPNGLWKVSNITPEYCDTTIMNEFKNVKRAEANISDYATSYGICMNISIEDALPYSKLSNELWVCHFSGKISRCACGLKHYIIPKNGRFDHKNFIIQPCYILANVLFARQTLKRLNTPRRRCVESEDAFLCSENCFNNTMMSQNISCKLPFMTSLFLPLCNTSQSAKRSMNAYYKGYVQTNHFTACQCQISCEEEIYIPQVSHANYIGRYGASIIKYNAESNIREVVKENYAFAMAALLCDIGSNLGILLGISLMSILQDINSALFDLKLSKTRK